MDRISGPFPIVKIGRRVWIDVAGFESYLSSTRDELARTDPEQPVLVCDREALHSSNTVGQHECVIERTVPEVTAAIPAAARPWAGPPVPAQESACGQRDLLFGWVYRPNLF
jgi:hypothetical protein